MKFSPLKSILLLLLIISFLNCGKEDTPAPEEPISIEEEEETVENPQEEEEEEEETETETFGDLKADVPPSENFDLAVWKLSIPTDVDGSGTADDIKENELSTGYEDPRFFYTAEDGGMVFKCPVAGFKTSTNTSYTRVELREMLRRGDTDISTTGISKNNWVFGSAPQEDIDASGGFDGVLNATLAVNHVTTTGSSGHVGRLVIAQIHANNDEPIRLYYRKLPNNELGAIYFAHEENQDNEFWFEMIGSRSNSADNPTDGIALNEVFSYRIEVVGNLLTATIIREDKEDVMETVNMANSGYDVGGQYMYFKAGVYHLNNSGNSDDYAQATFYSLSQSHSN